jgi:uncharacterized membrane protein YgdD (TMEM256/DUF423 family)
MRTFLFAGAINGFIAVALGAFAAHGLSGLLSARMLDVFETGAEYQLSHALVLIAVGLLCSKWPQAKSLKISGWAFITGLVLFPFSLYALALTGIGWLGMITPMGGVTFLLGWASLAYFALKQN